ncbi:MAG: flippase [Bacteroides sp.]|nr:flippase [Bacteroides sp.]
MPSVKRNILLNGINTVTSILFPMVTFPYAARVLLPEGIGAVNFLLSIVNYVILLTSLGIPLYAVKEIAKYRDEVSQRDKVAVEIILLSFVLCFCGYFIIWILGKFVPQIHQQLSLFYILSLSLFFNTIGVEWFYKGIEDFKFITFRAVIIRTLSAVCLFIFVKNVGDILIYGIITVGATVGNNIINFVHLRKYLNLRSVNVASLKVLQHLKPSLHVFLLNLIISLYVHLNSVMLGFIKGEDSVGYFTAGTKISHIGLVLISSIGTVMLPRCSNMIQKGDFEGFNNLIYKSIRLTILLSFPIIVGLIVLATPITIIFCGNDYIASIPVLYLNAPVILLIGLTNVMGIQILYPKNKLNIVIWSVTGGAIINIILNIILIPLFSATGAAISTLVAEAVVFLIQAFYGRKYYPFKWTNIIWIRYLIGSLVMGGVIFLLCVVIQNMWIQIIMSFFVGILVYILILYGIKDDMIRGILNYIIKLKRRNEI